MSNAKTEYIHLSLKKISHKKWEYFLISRILHRLDDFEIEFVSQQLVRCTDATWALTDIFFPQFNLHLEIDERHHLNQQEADDRRQQDIVDVTGHEIIRIRVTNDESKIERKLIDITKDADDLVHRLTAERRTLEKEGKFIAWDFDHRYDPERIIKQGTFSVADNVLFRTQIDAMRCFGFTGKVNRRGGWRVPDQSGDWLWFPRLYRHGMWRNELCEQGTIIYERALDDDGRKSIHKQTLGFKKSPDRNMIVFAKAKDPLGTSLLRYVGTFRVNLSDASPDCLRFDRVRDTETIRYPAKQALSR